MKGKIVLRWWTPWSYKKHEKWLEYMESIGWHLVKVQFLQSIYYFENEAQRKIKYCIDYQSFLKPSYEQICQDDHWELVSIFNGWYIWRKDYIDKIPEIYTDIESLLKMNLRIICMLIVTLAMQYFVIGIIIRNLYLRPFILIYFSFVTILIYSLFRIIIHSLQLKRRSE